jgi:hypothetical protein
MAPQPKPARSTTTLTRIEQRSLRGLRARYQQDHDLFSDREIAQLRFLRWLYENGWVVL